MFCPNCGKQLPDGTNFCPECGAALPGGNQQGTQSGVQQDFQGYQQGQQNYQQGYQPNFQYAFDPNANQYNQNNQFNTYRPTYRSIATCIILSFVTCGIYLYYWMYVLNEDINGLERKYEPSGVTVILLSIVTCGIYQIIWMYNVGTAIDRAKTARGSGSSSCGVIYLVLMLFGLGIVSMGLAQNELNQMSQGQ